MISMASSARDRAVLLLKVIAEMTRVEGPPVIVTTLRERTGLTDDELIAAWRYLKDQGHIDANWALHAARINPAGISALGRIVSPVAQTRGALGRPGMDTALEFLNQAQRCLLDDLIQEFVRTPDGVDARKFLSKHSQQVTDMDVLLAASVAVRWGDKLIIRLPALPSLARQSPTADSLWFLCGHVLSRLGDLDRSAPGAPITVSALTTAADMPLRDIRRALSVLSQAPIWSAPPSNLTDPSTTVTLSEGILRYPDLPAILEWFRQQSEGHLYFEAAAVSTDAIPHPKALVEPPWHARLGAPFRKLYVEVYFTLNAGAVALPAMGLRAILDLALNDVLGDVGGFAEKLKRLVSGAIVTERRRQVIADVLEVGHAAMHRGYVPSAEQVQEVLTIVEHVVYELLISEGVATRIRSETPQRGAPKV